MGFDWRKYVKFSEKIIQNNKSEECARTSISRAYYGVFCICRDRVSHMLSNENYHKLNVHQEVANIYKKSNIEKEKEIYELLIELRKKRNIADYNGDQKIYTKLAENMIDHANKILEILNEIDSHESTTLA